MDKKDLEIFGADIDFPSTDVLTRLAMDNFHGDDPRSWVGSIQELLWWLYKCPQATAHIQRWGLIIKSPVDVDVITIDRFEPPCGLNSCVENHCIVKEGEIYVAEWSFG